jgi:hypothetical protein
MSGKLKGGRAPTTVENIVVDDADGSMVCTLCEARYRPSDAEVLKFDMSKGMKFTREHGAGACPNQKKE